MPGHSACPEVSAKGSSSDAEDVGSLQTRMGSSQGASDAAGGCPGAKRGAPGSLGSNTGESPALPWGGAGQAAPIWDGAKGTNHSPKKHVSSAHRSVLPSFHAKG